MIFENICNLGKNTTDEKNITKSITWNSANYNFNFLENTNYLLPTILITIEHGTTSVYDSAIQEIINCDYLVLNKNSNGVDFSNRPKYYFIRNITPLGDGLIQLDLEMDTISTYANELKNTECVIERNEKYFSLYFTDDFYTPTCYPLQNTVEFPSGFSNSYNYILSTIGKRI